MPDEEQDKGVRNQTKKREEESKQRKKMEGKSCSCI